MKRLALTTSLAFTLIANPTFNALLTPLSDITTGLVASYPLNEASGNALDASGNSRTMTQNGTVGAGSGGTANSRGTYSTANYFSRLDAAFQLNSGNYTICGWFYLTATATTEDVVTQLAPGANAFEVTSYFGGGSASKVFMSIYTGAGGGTQESVEAPGSAVGTGAWNFFVMTYAAGTKVLTGQVNGGSVGTLAVSGTPNVPTTTSTKIGVSLFPGFENPMTGYAAKIKIYSRVLAAADIAALYNGGTFSSAP